MLEWINSHGIECMLAYLAFATIVGSMPVLPDNAGYLAKWGYAFLHGLAMNWRSAMSMLKIAVPDTEKKDG